MANVKNPKKKIKPHKKSQHKRREGRHEAIDCCWQRKSQLSLMVYRQHSCADPMLRSSQPAQLNLKQREKEGDRERGR